MDARNRFGWRAAGQKSPGVVGSGGYPTTTQMARCCDWSMFLAFILHRRTRRLQWVRLMFSSEMLRSTNEKL